MAPKKPTVTSSSTRSARAKTGSNPVVTKGEARTRAARTTLGPAPKQRPMASGGTKGPLQGGTRTMGKTTPSGITMSGDKQAAIKAGGTRPAPKPAFGPVPSGPSERTIRSMEAGPAKVKGGMSQQSTLSSKPGANAARAQAGKDTARMNNRTAKGYGQPGKVEGGLRQLAKSKIGKGGAAVLGLQAVSAVQDRFLSPKQLANKREFENYSAMDAAAPLLKKLSASAAPSKYGPRFKNAGTGVSAAKGAKPAASTSRFAGARDKAMAKAKAIKGSPVLGPKKVGSGGGKLGTIAQAFDKSFAAARKAGKSGFTFKGKKYNTKMA